MPNPDEILMLFQSESGYISGQELARRAGISRSAVWKQIRALRRFGYSVESRHGIGYRLTGLTDLPVPWELTKILDTSFVGRKVVFRETVDSTQDLALSLADKPDSLGMVVIAEQQKTGRGRHKRKWLSPKGGVWLSVVLKPKIPISRMTLLPFIAALAVCDAIKSTGLDARLKWPNDVMISGRKVAGILLDVSAEVDVINYAVIGIGINANIDTQAISGRLDGIKITSISDELGHPIRRLELTKVLLENLEHYYLEMERRGSDAIIQKWKRNADMLGRKVTVIQNNKKTIDGIAVDVKNDGSLILRSESGDVEITSGDISVRY
ncbi:MAG: biotin--[acetyl-CoA-carboxylase] ligase [Nitrososphaera sp.]|jgi:BirA family biotin operon repressor/biotin-[acetyl-CoA-carboxylase] ligase